MDDPLNSIAENSTNTIEILPTAVMPSNNYSLKNANIKERLNLHVKRRIQDNTDGSVEQGVPLSSGGLTVGTIGGSVTSLSTTKSFENENGNIRGGNFNKRSHKLVVPRATNIQHTHARGGKRSRSRNKHHNNSSSLSSSVEDDCSRDEKPNICNKSPNATVTTTMQSPHSGNTKEKDSPDLLTWVLNEKKRSLMKNSDVIKYLESIIIALSK